MDFSGVLEGLSSLADPVTLLFLLVGVVLGMVVGVLPGFGPAAAIALLLPVSMRLDPVPAIVMFAGIYYGGMYGSTLTAVLLRVPGDASSIMTTLDGNAMARQGRAGKALGIAALSSLAGGTFAVICLTGLAVPITRLALMAGPPEYMVLCLLALVLTALVTSGAIMKSLIAVCLGLLLATVGQDPVLGVPRFTWGNVSVLGGLDIVALVMGLFGLGEVLLMLDQKITGSKIPTVKDIYPTRRELRKVAGPVARGSVLGFVIGAMPGGGTVLASMAAYGIERQTSRYPERFGKGEPAGVAAPEAANNAAATGAFAPLLTIGIPGSVVTAIIYSALVLQGVTPGPRLVTEHPDVFWGVIFSMYLGNIVLIMLAMPLIRPFVKILRVRTSLLAPIIVVIVLVGGYTTAYTAFPMWLVVVSGVLGYVMKKVDLHPAPLILAFVLGSILEQAFRQSMILSGGSLTIFVSRPFSLTLIAVGVAAMILLGLRRRQAARQRTKTGLEYSGSGKQGA